MCLLRGPKKTNALGIRNSVFERFKQVGQVLTDKPQGTGLGLPICRQICRAHRGRIAQRQRLKDTRVVAAGDLTPQKARILLMLALTPDKAALALRFLERGSVIDKAAAADS